MKFFSTILLTCLPGLTFATKRCADLPPPAALNAAHTVSSAREAQDRLENPNADQDKVANVKYAIKTYVHVIGNGRTDNVSDKAVAAQIATLNKSYQYTSFSFVLANLSRTIISNWTGISIDTPFELKTKKSLRQGAYKDLNLYLSTINDGFGVGEIIGFSTFPQMLGIEGEENAFYIDGVVVDPTTVPGGSLSPYNFGITAVHEIGHWFGLYHPFQPPLQPGQATLADVFAPGCVGDGDYIYDTPAEGQPAFGCPTGRDTCSDLNSTSEPGVDPIHNFMDYSDDTCLTQFTRQQQTRMLSLYQNLRLGSFVP